MTDFATPTKRVELTIRAVILGSVLALSHTTAKLTQEAERERLFHQVWSGIERMLRRSELAMNSMHRRRPSVGK